MGSGTLFAQAPGCPDIDAGPDENLNCTTNCTDLTATVLETGQTTSYEVSSIPYAPPASFTSGTQLFVNIDDVYSDAINLPFNFCFYGNMYSQIVVGTNGVVTFDASLANAYCPWSFNASVPSANLPPNSIMGAYHDIDPSEGGNINYAILGSAPCRTLVVNFYDVPHFDCDCGFFGSCSKTTQQIVIYETTNVIEVYLELKETCSSWNSGNAVIGVQNAGGTTGITPPGRNTGPWNTSNEAWRFTPNGAPSYTVNWYDGSNNLVGTGLTVNVCPTSTTTYTGEATYQHCDGSQVVVTDQVTVNIAGGFTTSQNTTPEACPGVCDGSVTVTASSGTPPYSFDIGNGSQSTGDFTGLCAGTYTVTVSDNGGCSGTVNVVINSGGTISVTESFTDETCAGANDGTITLTASGGTPPYGFDIGYGSPNTSGAFTNLPPGTYNYAVADVNQCPTTGTIVIADGANCCNMTNTVASTDPTCNGVCDGTITLTETDGIAPVQFSIDGGSTFQASGTFIDLCDGTYDIVIVDANGCQYDDQVVLTEPSQLTLSSSSIISDCGVCDGTIDITANGGAGSYQYSIDNGVSFQASASFASVCPDDYDVVVEDASGCQATGTVSVDVASGPSITGTNSTDASCITVCDGEIDITAISAVQYSVDSGLTWQASNVFSALCTGTYNVMVEDANGCQVGESVQVGVGNGPSIASIDPTQPSCNGVCDGLLDITSPTAVQYSIDNGTTWQASGSFSSLCAGNYDIMIEDANGCQEVDLAVVDEPTPVTLSTSQTDAKCFDVCDGSITVVADGGTPPYLYSIDNGVNVQAQGYFSNLCDGAYDILVADANLCPATDNTTIAEPTELSMEVETIDPTCNGDCDGMAMVTVSGGTPNYVYTWSTGETDVQAQNLCDGTYALTVTDVNGCVIDTTNIVITEPVPMAVDDVTVTDEICYADCEGSISIAAAGATQFSIDGGANYSSSSLFYPLCAGSYAISVQSDAGCGATASAEILRPVQVIAGFYSDPIVTTEIEPMIEFFNTSTGATIYHWDFGNDYTSADTNPSYDYNNGEPGIYEVCLVALNDVGCSDTVCQTVIMQEVFTIYVPNAFTPNDDPFNNEFMPVIDGDLPGTYQFRVFNRWGQQVFFTTDKNKGWDGTVETMPAQQEVYIWKVIVTPASGDDDQVFMGRVTLIR